MQQPPPDRSSLAQTAITYLVTLASTAMLGLVLAYWTWAWLAPRAETRAPAPDEFTDRAPSARTLFGAAQVSRTTLASTGSTVRLLGVMATSRRQRGYAVVQLDGRGTVVVREGGEVSPGVRLVEIHPDHVVMERAGVRETLAWPAKPSPATPPPLPRQ